MQQSQQRDPQTYAIIGAAMEVHRELGPGFLEAVYQEALEIELELRGVPFVSQEDLDIYYKTRKLKKKYRPDFLCFENVIVEIKAEKKLISNDESQMLNYLKASRCPKGLLINFGAASLERKRYVYRHDG